MIVRFICKALVLPPMLNIVLIVAGLWWWQRSRRLALVLILVSLGSLYALSTMYVANALLLSLERHAALDPSRLPDQLGGYGKQPEAIVVLGTGNMVGVEYGGPRPDYHGQQRLDYAAFLHRRTGLPIMVTGGSWQIANRYVEPNASVAARYLRRDHDIRPKWIEASSRTTWENAEQARRILSAEGIDTVLLVTQSAHMRRGVLLFERMGFAVQAAPTDLASRDLPWASVYLWGPSGRAFAQSRAVLHEYLGLAWYALR